VKDKHLRPWLSVIAGGESLVSHAGGALLVQTARRSGLAQELSARLGPWRRPLATRLPHQHPPGWARPPVPVPRCPPDRCRAGRRLDRRPGRRSECSSRAG